MGVTSSLQFSERHRYKVTVQFNTVQSILNASSRVAERSHLVQDRVPVQGVYGKQSNFLPSLTPIQCWFTEASPRPRIIQHNYLTTLINDRDIFIKLLGL